MNFTAAVGCVTLSSLSELTHTYIHKAAQCSTIIKIVEFCPKLIFKTNLNFRYIPITKQSEKIKAVIFNQFEKLIRLNWIKLDQNGSMWFKQDQIGSN